MHLYWTRTFFFYNLYTIRADISDTRSTLSHAWDTGSARALAHLYPGNVHLYNIPRADVTNLPASQTMYTGATTISNGSAKMTRPS